MLKKPDAILFDLDGTLLDTAKDLGNALNHMLRKLGRPTVDYDVYRNIASDGAKGMLELGFGEDLDSSNFAGNAQKRYRLHLCPANAPPVLVSHLTQYLQLKKACS